MLKPVLAGLERLLFHREPTNITGVGILAIPTACFPRGGMFNVEQGRALALSALGRKAKPPVGRTAVVSSEDRAVPAP